MTDDLELLKRCFFHKGVGRGDVQVIAGGRSSARNYRVKYDGNTFLARIMPKDQPESLREKECLITDYVGKMGIGPKVYYHDSLKGVLITGFIGGRTARYEDMTETAMLRSIMVVLKKLHGMERTSFPVSQTIAMQIEYMLKDADSTAMQQLFDELGLAVPLNTLARWEKSNRSGALVHGDFNPNNILIDGERVYFIDWTNAGLGDAFADLSWCAIFHPLSRHKDLLNGYFGNVDPNMEYGFIRYYWLRMFLRVAWGIHMAGKTVSKCEQRLVELLKKQSYVEPCCLVREIADGRLVLRGADNLLLFSARVLKFLTEFTRTDSFVSAIEELENGK